MATSRVQVTEGSGKSLATHSFSEDAVTKEISRVNLNTSGGVETGVAASPLQVSLANTGANATSVVVDLGSNNDITGTVTANLSATDNAVLDAIEADTTTIAGAVAGTEMQVDIVSAPTLTVNAHAVTNAGTFVTQENGALLTAAQLIDDTVATLGTTTYTEAATKGNIIGAVRRDADTTLVDTTNEVGPIQMNAAGQVKVEVFSGETLPVSLTSTTVTGTVAVTQSGTWDEVGINDSGNSITVDGTITADLGATDNAVLDAIAASTAAIETAVEGTLTVTGGGGGTQYTEDAAAAANPVGGTVILVREDGRAGSLTTTDGDNVALRGNNKGEAYVKTTDSDALLTTIDADTGNISTKIDTIAGAVAGTEVQVDVLTMPTVTVNAHAVTNAGTFAVQVDGSALTSLQLADDVVATLGTTTYTEASTKGTTIGAVRRDADTTLVDTTNEIGPLQMDANGRLKVEAFSGETLPVSLTSTTVTGTVAVTQSGTWDEVGINDSGNSITVDYATTGSGTATGALRVELPTNGTGVIATVGAVTAITNALPAGTNAIGKLAANSGVDIGDVDVTSISAGTNSIGNVGLIGRTTGGLSIFRSLDIDESEEEVKATAGQVFTITAFNTTAAPLYLKFYNATAASVTVGSTTPVLTFLVPGNADSDGAGFVHSTEIGYAFGTAITVACTTAIADADTGAPSANACLVNIGYM